MKTENLPLLPIRNTVTMPGTTMPLVVGRPRSVEALKYARDHNSLVVITAQHRPTIEDPVPDDLYRIGTLCRIEKLIGSDQHGYQVIITGLDRYRLDNIFDDGGFLRTDGEIIPDQKGTDALRLTALFNSLKDLSKEILSFLPNIDESIILLIGKLDDPSQLTYLCTTYLNLTVEQKQALLETVSLEERIETLLKYMQKEREVVRVQKEIRDKMSERMSRAQRDGLLREQMKAIKDELGEGDDTVKDEIIEKLEKANLPEEVKKVADKEIKRLENIPPASAEFHVIRNYLEWLADMPWTKSKAGEFDIPNATKVLDEDHYGVEKVKKRILQYLAVAKMKNDLRGPILCLVGPPGVGKTSLGQSIAKAMGREFIRTSLGGIRDEAEIRGHRRTYVGAMPGRIIQSIKRAGVNNPVMMLDEIDKLGVSFQGDPAAAMLELLDPEQNKFFFDHYLDVPYDLSNVFFIATANMIDTIPGPLRDRLEIIELSSYTILEKMHIAKSFLVPKQLKEHGLSPEQVAISDEALNNIIVHYTREAGVRELQRNIAAICRSVAMELVEQVPTPIQVTAEKVIQYLGLKKFISEVTNKVSRAGVVTGMAWTPVGGDILFIEASIMPGTGQLRLTGQLGDVMKESAQIAMSYVRAELSKISKHYEFDKYDIHIHVPSGAIPKDGPSAGITMLMAITSLLSGKKVEPTVAMTGEITLRGTIMPVGGIKEKVLAAHRAGIRELFIPKRNEPDFSEIPKDVKDQMKVHFVEDVREVLKAALGIEEDKLERDLRIQPFRSIGPLASSN